MTDMAKTEATATTAATTIMTAEGERFRDRVLKLAGDEVKKCIQCGTCSASCPTAHLMDVPIRKLIRLVLEGEKEKALSSRSIWLCTSCLLCTVRCPRNIRPMAVVAALKTIYEEEGMRCRDSVFEGIFSRQIRDYGRISERGERIEGTEEVRRIFELLGDEGKAEAEKVDEAAEAGETKKAEKAEDTKEAPK
ncbi:MAG: CoB-CoM heterodisulfide reductase, subunit C [Methanothrix harundinacea]|uniref:CoB-CoM heterodisulfide reductase, subunit C n=2 Tax=Methanothrix harundinacea TaxID=301375 RepID=A0A101ILF7_9EURY|nr:MAG: CoB-CoM heterodisulfide reductase, subunit C [Methanothrix harundinacea]